MNPDATLDRIEPEPTSCPRCGAWLGAGAVGCPACVPPIEVAFPDEAPPGAIVFVSDVREAAKPPRASFHISSMMLVIGLIAACLGVGHEAPALGLIVAVVAVPGLIVALTTSARRAEAGRPMGAAEKLALFLVASVLSGSVGLAALTAFVAVFGAIGLLFGYARGSLVVGILVGLGVAGALATWLARGLIAGYDPRGTGVDPMWSWYSRLPHVTGPRARRPAE